MLAGRCTDWAAMIKEIRLPTSRRSTQPAMQHIATNRGLWSLARVAALAAGLAMGGQSLAQVNSLPAGLIKQAGAVDAGGEGQIQQFAKTPLEQLGGEDPDAIRRGRSTLLDNVSPQTGPSVSFRLAYAKVLVPELEKLMAKGEMAQVNALMVAGELGADSSLRLLEQGRKSTLASVRFSAAQAAERAIVIYRQGQAVNATALSERAVKDLLAAQGTVLKTESDHLVADKAMSVLTAAVSVNSLREDAIKQLDEGLAELVKKHAGKALPEPVLEGMARTAAELRQALLAVGGGNAMPQAVSTGSAGVAVSIACANISSIKAKAVAVGAAGDGIRTHIGAAAGAAESLGNFVTQNASGFGLSDKVRKGTNADDAAFVASAQDFIKLMKDKARVPAARCQ